MKKLLAFCGALALLCAATPALADFTQTVDVYAYAVGPANISWSHTYDGSADPIDWATLTIVADDVDGPGNGMDGEQDMVSIQDSGGTWHDLGLLNDIGYYTNYNYQPGAGNLQQPLTTTVFSLDTSWLAIGSVPVQVAVESGWGVEIETSTLTVQQVPVPGAGLLGMLGLSVAGAKLRRRKEA